MRYVRKDPVSVTKVQGEAVSADVEAAESCPEDLAKKSHGQRSLVGCSPWCLKESEMT